MSTPDFTSFLRLMAQQKASDLFITSGMPPSIKVHGKIAPITQTPLTSQQSGMMTLDQHLQDLVKRALITRNQAKEYAKDKRLFE